MRSKSTNIPVESSLLSSVKSGLLMVLAFLVIVMSGCVSTSTHEQALAEMDAVKKDRDSVKNNNAMLKNQVASYEEQAKKLGLELDKTSTELSAKEQALREREEKLKLTAEELAAKNDALRNTSLELSMASEELVTKEKALAQTQEQLRVAAEREKETHKLYDDLVGELNTELKAKQMTIKEMKDGLVVNLTEAILFPSGSAELNKSGVAVLTKVSDKLQTVKYQIVVAGFTDDIPISGSLAKRYPTNWELAGARAASVVRIFEKNGLDIDKLAAVSYGETHNIMPNDTAEGRAQNRRIEIRLRPTK